VGHFFHAEIFRLLVAEEYAAVSPLLPWMILASGVFAAGQTITLKLMTAMKTKSMIVPRLTTALTFVPLAFAGAHWFGVAGVVIAGIVVSVQHFCWLATLARDGVRMTVRSE
jgi:O-antigen/teichoic acid export membrane protein